MFSYKRWRHTRGFGVHSPFAYRLIRYAIRPRPDYAFYADEELEDLALSSGCSGPELRRAKKLLRLAVTLDFRKAVIWLPGERECFLRLCEAALKAADSAMTVSRNPEDLLGSDFFWSDAREVPLETICLFLHKENRVVLLEASGKCEETEIFKWLPEGVMLYGRRRLLAVHKPGVMKISYSVNV